MLAKKRISLLFIHISIRNILCSFFLFLLKAKVTFFCLFVFFSSNQIVFVFAIIACAVAIPAGAPQPRPIAPVQRQRAASPESEQLTTGADEQDLKGSSSYGYGYYGGLGGYYGGLGSYYGGYPYAYSTYGIKNSLFY